MRKLLKFDFVRFCVVGASGFLFNLALLSLFYKYAGWPLFWSQLLAAEIALFSNFILHHTWTYKANKVDKTLLQLIIQFHLSSWVAILGSAVLVNGGVRWLHLSYFLALVMSSAIALGWNFGWTKLVIWKHSHAEASKGEEL
jgi:dolichol-phosphate mannosyltransferase